MKNICHFCDKDLKKILTTWDIRYAFLRWPNGNFKMNNKSKIWIPSLQKNSCIDCGIKYYKFIFTKNKINKFKTREINGKFRLTKYIDQKLLNVSEYLFYL